MGSARATSLPPADRGLNVVFGALRSVQKLDPRLVVASGLPGPKQQVERQPSSFSVIGADSRHRPMQFPFRAAPKVRPPRATVRRQQHTHFAPPISVGSGLRPAIMRHDPRLPGPVGGILRPWVTALLCASAPVAQWIEQRVPPLSEGALALLSGSSAAAV